MNKLKKGKRTVIFCNTAVIDKGGKKTPEEAGNLHIN